MAESSVPKLALFTAFVKEPETSTVRAINSRGGPVDHRCVTCGRPESAHGPDKLCLGSAGAKGSKFASMALPQGYTCSECAFFAGYCVKLFDCKPESITCDWYPIRFAINPEVRPA